MRALDGHEPALDFFSDELRITRERIAPSRAAPRDVMEQVAFINLDTVAL